MMEISRRCDNTSASALLLLSNIDADLSNSIYQKLANIMQNCGICKMLIEAYLSSHELTAHHNALSGEYRMPEYIWIFIATAAKHNYEKYRKYRKWLITDTFDNPLYMLQLRVCFLRQFLTDLRVLFCVRVTLYVARGFMSRNLQLYLIIIEFFSLSKEWEK